MKNYKKIDVSNLTYEASGVTIQLLNSVQKVHKDKKGKYVWDACKILDNKTIEAKKRYLQAGNFATNH